eukprot:462251_1
MQAFELSAPLTKQDVIATDFDGVVCDSVGELSLSAFHFLGIHSPPTWAMKRLREIRNVVETGWENIILAQAVLEAGKDDTEIVKTLLEKWNPCMRAELMKKYGHGTTESLIDGFQKCRDEWILKDKDDWLNSNAFYAGIPEAVQNCPCQMYVITTKQEQLTRALLGHCGTTRFREGEVFGFGSGPKRDVLATLLKRMSPDNRLIFIEDRLKTLEDVCRDPRLSRVELYLASWGYNSDQQLKSCEDNPRITVISLEDFEKMLLSSRVGVMADHD